MKEAIPYNYTLYADKYTYQFEKYCLDHGLGKKQARKYLGKLRQLRLETL